jgi:hypothetical protein
VTFAEYIQRVRALKQQFGLLFAEENVGCGIAPGWFAIVRQACSAIERAIDHAQDGDVRITRIREKMGGLRVSTNVRVPRLDFSGPIGDASRRTTNPCVLQLPPLPERVLPILERAERESYETCLFCGAPGRLRDDRRWILTLCDRHSSYGYHHLDLAFEQMTDPDRDPVPPTRDQVISAIRAQESRLRACGISCLGLLPPLSAARVWRLVVEDGEDAYEVLRAAQSAVAWPLALIRTADGAGDHLSFRDIIWARREQ